MDIYKWHHTKKAEIQQHQTVLEIHQIQEKRQHWCFPIKEQRETEILIQQFKSFFTIDSHTTDN